MQIYSWGSNSHGQLGQGTETEQILFPVPTTLNVEPKCITGGGKHTVLLTTSGEVFTCGDNDKGQLGKKLAVKLVNTFKHLAFPIKLAKISCGWDYNLVLTENGEVFAWGSNSFGQLGLPVKNVKYLSSPYKIFEKPALDIGAGLRHSVIVSSEGSVFTSGFGRRGQLGVYVDESLPSVLDKFTLVENLRDCKKISCGECHCLAITANEELYSWGNNKYGQLGFDPTIITLSATPAHITLSLEIKGFSNLLSGWAHNFILTENGQLLSWGRNDFGQLGEIRQLHWKPKVIKNIKKIKQVVLGSHHTLALTEKGEVLTWGWNEHGNCGNECCENIRVPYKLKDFTGVKLIGSGAAHSFLFSYGGPMALCVYLYCALSVSGITDFSKIIPSLSRCPEMNTIPQNEVLEIKNLDAESNTVNEAIFTIPVIETTIDYSEFFHSFLLPNKPCLINDAAKNWPCVTKWIKNKSLNVEYFRSNFKNVDVPISDCQKREFNAQKKTSMKLFDYLNYWEEYEKNSNKMDCLYLKDWHFMKEFPSEEVYRVPSYFASDWLNEYYDSNLHLKDDYRFVYIGPRNSWTPFHADVFNSYSWSVNICGRKKWVLFPPGVENNFRDSLGNLIYDIDLSQINLKERENKFHSFEVIQEEGQALFVPSGWHHQVWNLENTISVNHNWINGCNIEYVWQSLKKNLLDVKNEISDCKEMEDWMSQCQLILSATFGFDYQFFYSFLANIALSRIASLKEKKNIAVYGNWSFGRNHMKFDLKRVLTVLEYLEKDEDFVEIKKIDNTLNHAVEFLGSLNTFLNTGEL